MHELSSSTPPRSADKRPRDEDEAAGVMCTVRIYLCSLLKAFLASLDPLCILCSDCLHVTEPSLAKIRAALRHRWSRLSIALVVHPSGIYRLSACVHFDDDSMQSVQAARHSELCFQQCWFAQQAVKYASACARFVIIRQDSTCR